MDLESKRVSFNLSGNAYSQLWELCKISMRSPSEVIRLGLGLIKIAIEAEKEGNKLIVTTHDGKPIKEVVLD